MHNFNFKNQSGEISARDALITTAITLALSIVIIIVFIIWSSVRGRLTPQAPGTAPPVGAGKERGMGAQTPGAADTGQTKEKNEEIVAGVLTAIAGDQLIIRVEKTDKEVAVFLNNDTAIEYNGAPFAKSRFYIGDQLAVTAMKENNRLAAKLITVLVAASPAAPAPVPGPGKADIRPDGSIKPLGGN